VRAYSQRTAPLPHLRTIDPVDVLAQHLFHIQELDLGACSCSILPWVRLLKTATLLLKVLWLRVNPHHPRMRHDVVVPLPSSFLATHPCLHCLFIDGALLSSWTVAPSVPLVSLTHLSICAPDLRRMVRMAMRATRNIQ
jgi:hypothetical protein